MGFCVQQLGICRRWHFTTLLLLIQLFPYPFCNDLLHFQMHTLGKTVLKIKCQGLISVKCKVVSKRNISAIPFSYLFLCCLILNHLFTKQHFMICICRKQKDNHLIFNHSLSKFAFIICKILNIAFKTHQSFAVLCKSLSLQRIRTNSTFLLLHRKQQKYKYNLSFSLLCHQGNF